MAVNPSAEISNGRGRDGRSTIHSLESKGHSVTCSPGVTNLTEPCSSCYGRGNCKLAHLLSLVDRPGASRSLQTRIFGAGDHIYRTGDSFESLYAVKSGSVKSSLVSMSGENQVLAFHLPGDVLGLDSAGMHTHGSSAQALENTVVCSLPFARLEEFVVHSPGAFRWFLELAGSVLSGYQSLFTMLSRMKAEARLSQFLLDQSQRYRDRGYSAREFNLTMSRQDISNHLGLALETVSRLIARFQRDGMVNVERRKVTILDAASLEALASSTGASESAAVPGAYHTVRSA
jgi:CRP/FNR family transcriptional regulator